VKFTLITVGPHGAPCQAALVRAAAGRPEFELCAGYQVKVPRADAWKVPRIAQAIPEHDVPGMLCQLDYEHDGWRDARGMYGTTAEAFTAFLVGATRIQRAAEIVAKARPAHRVGCFAVPTIAHSGRVADDDLDRWLERTGRSCALLGLDTLCGSLYLREAGPGALAERARLMALAAGRTGLECVAFVQPVYDWSSRDLAIRLKPLSEEDAGHTAAAVAGAGIGEIALWCDCNFPEVAEQNAAGIVRVVEACAQVPVTA